MDLKKEQMNSTDLDTQGESHANVPGIGTPETPVTEEGTGYVDPGVSAAPATVEGESEQADEPAAENDAD